MRHQKDVSEKPRTTIDEVKERVYKITTVSAISESLRIQISEEFKEVVDEHHDNPGHDYYLDIYALADYYDTDPITIEQYLIRRFPWLSAKLYLLKNPISEKELTDDIKSIIRDYVAL